MRKLYFSLLLLITSVTVFSQGNFTVLGNASQLPQCNCFQLTPNAGGQAGAFFQNNTINLNNSFDFTFRNFFGCNGASGADGEAFVLTTNPNGLGNQGEGLGYGGSNQPCSFAVEFDTWQNGDHNDPGFDHTAYESGGSVDHNVVGPVSATASASNLDDCQYHTIEIVWNANTQTLSDYVDGSLRISQQMTGFINGYMCGNPIVNWGWTGSTGGGWNLQTVCMRNFSTWVAGINFESCSTTIQFTDVSTSNPGNVASWNWIFGDGTTSALQNPSHTYPSTGTYNASLIITNVNGCSDTSAHPVVIAAPIVFTPTLTNPLCNGGLNGSIVLSETGGFGLQANPGGYHYTWSNPAGDSTTLAGVGAGTYTVSCTDGICSASGQYTLNQPPALTATTSSTAASCSQNNGSCTITISGGTPPYNGVTWAGLSGTTTGNTTTVTGLFAGNYIANFHDANGCSAILQYTETVASLPCGINSTSSSTNVTCFGGSNGSVTLTVTGGNAPENITWTNAGGTTVGTGATVSNLPAGIYNYSYTDANAGHAFTGTLTITQPGAATVINLSTTNISCAGANNGQAIVSVTSGGAAPFSYSWSGGNPNNPVASNLGPGAITVTVTDANSCTSTATGNISSVPALQLNITTTNNGCNQYNNGSATANVTGGTTPYGYFWNNISTAQTDLSLAAGTYTVTVTDSNSCTITGTATISSSPPFINTVDSTNVKCYGGTTGSVTVNSSGGATPYVYSWSSDSTGTVNPALVGANLANLKAGEYLLTVTDAHGCTFFDSTFVQQPAAPLSVVTSTKNINCTGGHTGVIAVIVSGGTPTYSYAWTGGVSTTDSAINLAAGTYVVTVTDLNSCTLDSSFTLTEPAVALTLTPNQTNLSCYQSNDGVARITAAGGTTPYTYVWTLSPSVVDSATGLIAGNYGVLVTDNNQCTAAQAFVITQPTQIVPTPTVVNVMCFGQTNGSININTIGGTGGYTYIWSPNVSTTASATNLGFGTYDVTVTDVTLCSVSFSSTVTQPAAALTANYIVNNVPCFGTSTGSILVSATGGTVPYTYSWNPNVSGADSAVNLPVGNYAITVTDLNQCSVNSSFTLTQPATALTIDSTQTDLTCYGSNNGAAYVTASGGTSPYSDAWFNSASALISTTDSATGLAAGTYSVLVTDSNHCIATLVYTITQPTQIVPTAAITNVNCFGQSTGAVTINTVGGAGGYTYTWNPNVGTTATATNLAAGLYDVTVTDATTCTASTSVNVTQIAQINLTTSTIPVNCNGGSAGSAITVSATGGTPGYSYTASAGGVPITNTTGQFSNIPAATYVIITTDQNGCADTTSAIVSQPNPLTYALQFASPTCSYLTNGEIIINATGGNPSYTFSGTNLTTNSAGLFTGLAAGTYAITITDSKGCDTTATATLIKPDTLLVSVAPTSGQVKLGDSLALTTTTNQTGTITYAWTPDFGLSCYDCADPVFNGVYSQPYKVTVTNDSGCVATFGFEVTVIPNYDYFIPNAFTPNGDGKNDYWQMYGNMSALKQVDVMVFDRIGEKVFESTDINFKWDGTFKGQAAPLGVYVYAIKLVWLDNHSTDAVKGTITLLK